MSWIAFIAAVFQSFIFVYFTGRNDSDYNEGHFGDAEGALRFLMTAAIFVATYTIVFVAT